MNKKKVISTILPIIIAIICMVIPSQVKASNELSTKLYFGIKEFRSGTVPENLGYAINNPLANTSGSIVGTKIWQIIKYDTNSITSTHTTGNYYCVKSGVGFTDTNDISEYNISYNMKTEKTAMQASTNTVVRELANSQYFNHILAMTDLMYLKGVSTQEEREALLTAAGINSSSYSETGKITDSDIEAVQQAALWYFTNHEDDTFDRVYNNYDKSIWLYYRTEEMSQNGDPYTSLSDYNLTTNGFGGKTGDGMDRDAQAVKLYRYLVKTAIGNSTAYADGTATPKTKVTLYSHATIQATQPIILIEKVPVKEFDLSLRKYIVAINGETNFPTRVPDIDESTIATTDTATYKHRKNPLIVKRGDKVTYNITVYNEGEKAGRATEIIDQLPEGLKYSKINTTGFTVQEDKELNRITISRNSNNETNLDAYTQNNLKSETIEIECIVEAKPDSTNQKILTNVAWISKEYDAEDNILITTEVGKDRDSEPANAPSVNKNNMQNYKGNTTNKEDLTDSTYYYKGEQDDDDFEKLVIEPSSFDLKLIKRIVEVNGEAVPERILDVDISKLNTIGPDNKLITTAKYDLNKNPVLVKKDDIVKYTFRIYNEGDIDGYASEISEDIPDGLEFIWAENRSDDEIDADTTLTQLEKEAIKFNSTRWDIKTINSTTQKVEMISTDYLAKGKGAEISTPGANLISAFDASKGYINTINSKNPDYKEVSVYLKVVAEDTTKSIIRNEAAITEDTDSDGNPIDDRDSDTEVWVKYEDDEDYDNIILQSFDLALRKFIIAVSKDTTIEESEYLKNSNGTYTRAPIVDTSKLNTIGEDGKLITTATYNHTKQPVEVTRGDIVVYMLRVYNEGDIDGYATKITDYLPKYLEFIESEFNTKYGWTVSKENKREVSTTYLSNNLISKITTNSNNEIVLSYKEVPIMCRVTQDAEGKLTNIAEIAESKDKNKNDIKDRDSETDNVKIPEDEKLPSYKDDETGNYIPGQQDDDDFEKVIVKKFDLALRKFITAVNDKEVTTRIPEVKYDSENKQITYEHTKEPVNVATTNIVTYTIRVFNEGEINGYASKVTDDIPDGLEFLPENDINKEYRWVMYDKDGKETDNIQEAEKITTDYLSKEQGEKRMAENSELTENPALLRAFDSNKEISDVNPDYADVKVAFKVIEPSTSSRIIVNSAQISDDTDEEGKPVDDIDSTPDEWIEGEDDQDKEYIKLNYFDLALRKWVTHAIVIENGKETVTQTGHKAEDDPEEVVKVELHRKKLNTVVVKFKYSIRVTNEGEIAGYAKEITDYIPKGLKFVAEDNPDWKDEGNNIISTRKLENTLLQPGESAEVEVLLTWINGNDNLGKKVNIAEISEDDNEYDAPDKDSTPDNKVPGEDDIDDAPVILTVATGSQSQIYIILGTSVLITLAGGIILIKKFVL